MIYGIKYGDFWTGHTGRGNFDNKFGNFTTTDLNAIYKQLEYLMTTNTWVADKYHIEEYK